MSSVLSSVYYEEVRMKSDNHDVQESGRGPEPSKAELAELARLRERFRRHRIFRDVTRERGVRYTAYGATVNVRPHTIITDDLAELRHGLEQAARRPLALSPSHQ
jgi:hypothetical protein